MQSRTSPLTRRELITSAAVVAMGAALDRRESLVRLAGRCAPADIARAVRETKTKFAINAEIWWGNLPFLDRIKKAKQFGFSGVEFWPFEDKPLDDTIKLCGDLGVEIAQFTAWGFSPGMNDPANHKKLVEQITKACEVANRLKCRKMTVVGGNDQKGMTQEQMHANITEGLRLVAPIAEAHKVMLILEPMNVRVDHKGHCLYGSPAAVKICRDVKSPMVKINWDLYHMQLSEGDLCGRLKDGIDQLGYAQVADTPGRHEPGTGEVHYNRVLKQLDALGYRDFVGLENWPIAGEEEAIKRVLACDVW